MASFTQQTNLQNNAPDWTGSSKKPDPSAYRPNRTFESLFSGVGDLVTGAAKVGSQYVESLITGDLVGGVERRRDAQGVGEVTAGSPPLTIAGEPDPNRNAQVMPANPGSVHNRVPGRLPDDPSVPTALSGADRLRQAHAEGRISQSYYFAQLEALSRQVRARYPGNREQIDEIMQKLTGVVPANALRNTVLAELQELKSKEQKQKDDERKFIMDNRGHWSPEHQAKYRESGGRELPPYAEVALRSSEYEADKKRLELESKRIDQGKKVGEQVGEAALKLARDQFSQLRGKTFSDLGQGMPGGSFAELSRRITEATVSGQPLTGEQQNLFIRNIAALEMKMQESFHQILHQNKPGSNTSLAQDINDEAKIKKLQEEAMAPIAAMKEALTNKQYGFFTATARMMEHDRDERARAIMQRHDALRNLNALGQVIPKEMIGQILNVEGGATNMSRVIRSINDTFTVGAAVGNKDNRFSKQTEEMVRNGATPDEINSAYMQRIATIASPNLDPKIRANLVKSMHGDPDFWSKVKRDNAGKIFEAMTAPKVTEAIIKAYKENPQEMGPAYKEYVNWTMNSFYNLNKTLAQSLTGINETSKYARVDWDEKNLQFRISTTPEGEAYIRQQARVGGRAGMPSDPQEILRRQIGRFSEMERYVTDFNARLKLVAPIWKEGGMEPSGEVIKTLRLHMQQLGVDPDKPSGPGIFQNMWQGIKQYYNKDKEGGGKTPITIGGVPINFQKVFGDNTTTSGNRTQTTGGGRIIDVRTGKENPPHFMGIREDVRQRFSEISEAVGFPLKVTPHGGVRTNPSLANSQHASHNRTAMDINTDGMSDEQKKMLVAESVRRGAGGVGSYSMLPSERTIHIDFRPRAPGAPPVVWHHRGAFDKKAYETHAPAWHREGIALGMKLWREDQQRKRQQANSR